MMRGGSDEAYRHPYFGVPSRAHMRGGSPHRCREACVPGHSTTLWPIVIVVPTMKSAVVQTISDRWNATLNYTMCPDAVVIGYHGYGTTQERHDAMKDTLKSLEAREGSR